MTTQILEEFPSNISEENILRVMEDIVAIRDNDIVSWSNLPQRFLSGRKVTKVPTASTDVLATDSENDFNWDEDFIYILINDTVASDLRWRRVGLLSW